MPFQNTHRHDVLTGVANDVNKLFRHPRSVTRGRAQCVASQRVENAIQPVLSDILHPEAELLEGFH